MTTESIICSNPECKADNPARAKFCRKCGRALTTSKDDYTPDLFPDIDLRPIAVKPIHFINIFDKISFILLPSLLIFLYLVSDNKGKFKDHFDICEEEFCAFFVGTIFITVLFAILCTNGIKHLYRLSNFEDNVDYIEEGFFMRKLKRIAKDKKLGLFDCENKVVLLTALYDSITKFDDCHIQLGKKEKIGLYSIPLKKIIVPVEYEGIAPVKNGVIEVAKDSRMSRYDIQGNVLK